MIRLQRGPGSAGESVKELYQELKQDYELQKYDDFREMLDQEQPDVAAVACHFEDHARISKEVLARDIHLFVEKPVATTLQDLELVEEVYNNSRSQLSAMH